MNANKCGNPFEVGKPVYVSTPQQLADWLNALAHTIGVQKTDTNPTGYQAWVDENGQFQSVCNEKPVEEAVAA